MQNTVGWALAENYLQSRPLTSTLLGGQAASAVHFRPATHNRVVTSRQSMQRQLPLTPLPGRQAMWALAPQLRPVHLLSGQRFVPGSPQTCARDLAINVPCAVRSCSDVGSRPHAGSTHCGCTNGDVATRRGKRIMLGLALIALQPSMRCRRRLERTMQMRFLAAGLQAAQKNGSSGTSNSGGEQQPRCRPLQQLSVSHSSMTCGLVVLSLTKAVLWHTSHAWQSGPAAGPSAPACGATAAAAAGFGLSGCCCWVAAAIRCKPTAPLVRAEAAVLLPTASAAHSAAIAGCSAAACGVCPADLKCRAPVSSGTYSPSILALSPSVHHICSCFMRPEQSVVQCCRAHRSRSWPSGSAHPCAIHHACSRLCCCAPQDHVACVECTGDMSFASNRTAGAKLASRFLTRPRAWCKDMPLPSTTDSRRAACSAAGTDTGFPSALAMPLSSGMLASALVNVGLCTARR